MKGKKNKIMYLNESSLWEAIVKKNDTSEDFV